jgi:hypothetical protein
MPDGDYGATDIEARADNGYCGGGGAIYRKAEHKDHSKNRKREMWIWMSAELWAISPETMGPVLDSLSDSDAHMSRKTNIQRSALLQF